MRQTDHALRELAQLLRSTAFRAERSRVLIVIGEAGTGKSHLLAAEANRALAESRPALLFLGQQFAQGNPWHQCERTLGLAAWPRDELFGALDAAGEASGARTLILVDAVNEGAGANLWRNNLSGFIESLAPYPHIGVVIACRSEYVPLAIPKPVLDAYPQVKLRGFTTFEEQEAAAAQYLDRRGIVRPAGPMMDPEFSHPLFLKAGSDALLRNGEFVFPRGLRGALKILGFYLDSVGGNLLPASVEPANLSTELRRTLAAFAEKMADSKLDFVRRHDAELLIAETFAPRSPPVGITWLDILLRNGIIRLDPDPTYSEEASFVAPPDVLRIAFQRLQDHLIVQVALLGAQEAAQLFASGGRLEWLLSDSRRSEWMGLFEALSIQVPETFDVELVDALPGGADRWWREWGLQEGFAQSVRWRAITSRGGQQTITDRSMELLNSLDAIDPLVLLLEVAVIVGHPWNAELLHRNLWRWKLNDRDLQWSKGIAIAAGDKEHPIHRLLSWSTRGKLDHADTATLQLVGIVLTWLCSTTSRYVRDTATRGLCRLLVKSPELHHGLLCSFAEVDDLYVLERLLAASYGAACQLGTNPSVGKIASTTFDLFFLNRKPPQHLLARDYALGTLELARHRGLLPDGVDLGKARPPFPAKAALRAPSEKTLKKSRDQIGDHRIFWSCGEHGDFGRYEIESAVRHFSAMKLTQPAPLSARNRFDLFTREVINVSQNRQDAFKALECASREIRMVSFYSLEDSGMIPKRQLDKSLDSTVNLEDSFLKLLDGSEQERYIRDARHYLFHTATGADRDPPCFDARWAQRWVIARAYKLGCSKDRFGVDSTVGYYEGRQRPRIERIGKKYQWIALCELLAWLSDTHWIKGDWGEFPRPYRDPTDTAFQRDFDPTLAEEADIEPLPNDDWRWLDFGFRPLLASKLTAWVATNDAWQSAPDAIFRDGNAGEKWVTIYSYESKREDFPDGTFGHDETGVRREGFLFVQSLLVDKANLSASYAALVAAKERDGRPFDPEEAVDGPFFGEYGWRATCPEFGWSPVPGLPNGVRGLRRVAKYVWEGHLDESRPDGVRHRFPVPELFRLMGLQAPSVCSPNAAKDASGRSVIVHRSTPEGDYSVSIRKQEFEHLLRAHDLGCLWFVLGERSAWPDGRLEGSIYRRFDNFVSFDGTNMQKFEWETPL